MIKELIYNINTENGGINMNDNENKINENGQTSTEQIDEVTLENLSNNKGEDEE